MPRYADSSQRRGFTFPSPAALREHRKALLEPPERPAGPRFVYRLDGSGGVFDHAGLPEGAFKAYLCSMMANNPFQALEAALARLQGRKQRPCEDFGLNLETSPAAGRMYDDPEAALSALQPGGRETRLFVGSGAIRFEESPQLSQNAREKPNSCVSTCVYGRWFSVSVMSSSPEIRKWAEIGRRRFGVIGADPASFQNSFYYNAYRVAQHLCPRICAVVAPHEYHPMAFVVLSLAIALKSVCCEAFNSSGHLAVYLPLLYGRERPLVSGRPAPRGAPPAPGAHAPAGSGAPAPSASQPPAPAPPAPAEEAPPADFPRTRDFLATLYANLPRDELAVLQRLHYSVYVVTPEEYLGPALVLRVLRAVLRGPGGWEFAAAAAGEAEPPDPGLARAWREAYAGLVKRAAFVLEILRPTDALLLADPQLVAAFAVLEGALLAPRAAGVSLEFASGSRAGLYRALAGATVDPGRTEQLLCALRLGLFYFAGETVPGVPEGVRELAQAAAEECMPLHGLRTDLGAYRELLWGLFDARLDFAVAGSGGE